MVWLLNLLLRQETEIAGRLICRLCFGRGQCAELKRIRPTVRTQEVTPEGKPDICIESSSLLAFVEVKTGSGLGKDQIERYLSALKERADRRTTRLALLTRDSVDLPEEQEKDVHLVRWHEVSDWLHQEMQEIEQESVRFVVRQFLGFLKEQIMTIEHIGWEYTNGIAAMRRMTVMLERSLEMAGLSISQKTIGWTWVGYYIEDMEMWTGVRFEDPNRFVLGFYKSKATVSKGQFESSEHYGDDEIVVHRVWYNGKPEFFMDLDDEGIHFFALSKESQLVRLMNFLKEAHRQAEACKEDEVSDAAP